MLKSFQLALLFVLLIPIAKSETQIFSGKVITDTDTDIDDVIFRFSYSPEDDKMFVASPLENLIIENGGCKSGNVFRVCINSVNFSYKNVTTYINYYESDLDVYKLTASLEATTISTLSEMLQGETAEITINIKNPMDSDITKITFHEDFQPFEVEGASGCILNLTKLTWQGSLEPTVEQVCKAKIVAKSEGTYTFTGNLNYFNGANTETRKTSITITVLPKQMEFKISADNETEAGAQFFVNFSLKNIHHDEDSNSFLQFKLPNNVELTNNISGFALDFGILNYSTEIGSDEEQYYSLYLKALSAGNISIRYKITYTIKNITNVMENETFIFIKEAKQLANLSKDFINASPSNLSGFVNSTNPEAINNLQEKSKGRFNSILLPIGVLAALVLFIILMYIIKKKRNKINPPYQEATKEIQENIQK